ncbi:MAG: Na(+)-translocating NADH-quinone reductase subunit A [Bacteroidia bacterium]|nr:Na(+)-translocating NADH-quinone reductase subunit A [Bacteroidia bacterium]
MSRSIKLRKGLDIQLLGVAEKTITPLESQQYAIKPTDFPGVYPKLLVKAGERVMAGTPLFFDKYRESIRVTSPVSGVVTEIVRGAKRVIQEIRIEADSVQQYVEFKRMEPEYYDREVIVALMLESGLWPALLQRPYAIVADYDKIPKAIVISGFDSAPLAPDYDILVHGHGPEFQMGLNVIGKLTPGTVHLNLRHGTPASKVFTNSKNVQINYFEGPHPAGTPGIQIHHLDPVNKNEVVWYLSPCAVLRIGRLFMSGHYDDSRLVALTGSEVLRTGYYKVTGGLRVDRLLANNLREGAARVISGNVLTGTKISSDGYLGFYDNQLTVIPEGNHSEFLGWIKPGLAKYSSTHAFLSRLLAKKNYRLDTNMHGGRRSFVVTGEMEKVFPMDILPLYLIKSVLVKDIDQMENLGIYEVGPEDFALCEFTNTSKEELQKIIREGLDFLRKEMN